MDADRTNSLLAALAGAVLVAASGLTACTAGGGADGHAASSAPALPTAADGSPLLCGILPRASVATALDRAAGTLAATGRLAKAKGTGHVHGTCTIASENGGDPALTAAVVWPSTKEAANVRVLIGRGAPYTFPDSYAPGVGYYNGTGTDVESQAVASVIWGDYVVSVSDNAPASGRSALDDSVALVHQIVDALDLARTPAA